MRFLPPGKEEEISVAITSVLQHIQAQVEQLCSGGSYQLRFLSSIAEGIDSMAAECSLALGYQLQCPLPMPRSQYLQTFEQETYKNKFAYLLNRADSVFEPDAEADANSEAYHNAAEILLNHSDILLAVWNGKITNYVAGTYPTIRSAMRSGIPVIIINAGEKIYISLCYRGRMTEDWEGVMLRILQFLRSRQVFPPIEEWHTELFRLLLPVGYAHRFGSEWNMLDSAPSSAACRARLHQREAGLPNIRLTKDAMRRFLTQLSAVCEDFSSPIHSVLADRIESMLKSSVSCDKPIPAGIGISLSSLRDLCLAAELAAGSHSFFSGL